MRALRDSSFCTSRKIVHTFLSYFPWTFQPSQETLKTMLMQNVGGGEGGGTGLEGVLWEMSKWQIKKI